jgi:hypothetical protein
MPAKLKPSTKEYERDSRGRMTNKYKWKHYTPSGTSTEELKKMYTTNTFRKKKNLIIRELLKRNEAI